MSHSHAHYRRQLIDSLWHQNPALVGLLGLCPLLAAGNSLIHGLALGAATTGILSIASGAIALLRRAIPESIRLPLFMIILATLVGVGERLIEAGFPSLHETLGLFIPLIITNCVILSRMDRIAYRNPPLSAAVDGFFMGLGFTTVLCALGGLRELIGTGTLLADADQLFGRAAAHWDFTLVKGYGGFTPALMPSGAFLLLGLLLAGKNLIDRSRRSPSDVNDRAAMPLKRSEPDA